MEPLLLDLGADPMYGSRNTWESPPTYELLSNNRWKPHADMRGDLGDIDMSWGESAHNNWRPAPLQRRNGHLRYILIPEMPSRRSSTLINMQVPMPTPSANRKRGYDEVDTDFAESHEKRAQVHSTRNGS
jgi:hypothetical protein